MTKADIVNEISKGTGVESAGAADRGSVHGKHQGLADLEQERLPEGLRQLHRQEKSGEGGPQHFEKHDYYDPCPQHPGIQAGQEFRRQSKSQCQIINHLY